MKSCGYCGKANEKSSVYCSGCGTEFSQPPFSRKEPPTQAEHHQILMRTLKKFPGLGVGIIIAWWMDWRKPDNSGIPGLAAGLLAAALVSLLLEYRTWRTTPPSPIT